MNIQKSLNFDPFEKSYLEKLTFTDKKIQSLLIPNDKECLEECLKEHKLFESKRYLYDVLSQFDIPRNSWLALEYFLINFLKDKVKLEKKDDYKWEWNKIDFFSKNMWVQLSTADKVHTKENELSKLRDKIEKWENLFYEEIDDKITYKMVIPNKEIPNSLALFSISSQYIQASVENWRNDFVQNMWLMLDNELINLVKDFEIIKNTFNHILEKIKYFEKASSRLSDIKPYTYLPINYNANMKSPEEKNIWEYKLEKVVDGIKTKYVKISINNSIQKKSNLKPISNISYLYNPKDRTIVFNVYRESFIKNSLGSELVYSFKYYFCQKKKVNNSFVKPEVVSSPSDLEKQELTNEQIKSNRQQIKSLIENTNQKITELKIKSKRIRINEDKLVSKFLYLLLKEIKEISLYQNLKDDLEWLNKDNEKRKKYIQCVESLKIRNKELIEKRKTITWLSNLIENIWRLLNWDNISFDDLELLSNISNEEILLNDAFISKYKFSYRTKKLKQDFAKILDLADKLNLEKTDFAKKLSKLLSNESTKRKWWINFIISLSKELNIRKREYEKVIEGIKNRYDFQSSDIRSVKRKWWIEVEKNKDNRKEKAFQRLNNLKWEISKIEKFERKLVSFKDDLLKLRDETSHIDFSKLLISYIDEENMVYNSKFLLRTFVSIIFNWEYVCVRNTSSSKLEDKLKNILWNKKEISENLRLLEMYIQFKDVLVNNEINLNPKIETFKNKLNKKLEELKLSVNIEDSPVLQEYKEYFSKSEEVSKLLENLFSTNIIKKYKGSIAKFITSFLLNGNVDFDKEFQKLVKNIWVENIPSFYPTQQKLENIKKYKSDIENFNWFGINIEELSSKEDFVNARFYINQLYEDLDFKISELQSFKW